MTGAQSHRVAEAPAANRKRTASPSGWLGWVIFAGIIMIMLGAFQAIAGLPDDSQGYRFVQCSTMDHPTERQWCTPV